MQIVNGELKDMAFICNQRTEISNKLCIICLIMKYLLCLSTEMKQFC